jgi:hypothetical protein
MIRTGETSYGSLVVYLAMEPDFRNHHMVTDATKEYARVQGGQRTATCKSLILGIIRGTSLTARGHH